MLTSTQLADELGLTKNTVLRLANTGKIPCLKLPTARGDFRFDLEAVREVLRQTAVDNAGRGAQE
jgi:excisionase family DNA binding protein